jgi:homoserine dehydrogenase
VVGDLVDVARNILKGSAGRVPPPAYHEHSQHSLPLKDINDIVCQYYLRFQVLDRPGVLAAITGILGNNQISIASVIQKGRGHEPGAAVSVVMMTHEAQERSVRAALQAIQPMDFVQGDTMCVRVEDPESE